MFEIKHFINGETVGSKSGRTFPDFNPATAEQIGVVDEAGRPEVDQAVAAARAALRGPWGRLAVEERMAMLHRIADRITQRFDEFLEAECLDTGKPASLASHIDIPRGAANFKIFADLVKNVPTESFMLDTPDGQGALNYAQRRPKGVIAVVCPWNLPLLLMTWKVGPALACGNCVVVKPSEETPHTCALLGSIMNEVGVPPGVFNVVHGFGPDSAGEYLTSHPDIDGVTFTGESRTGSAIMAACAPGIKQVSFELGGKNPGIVFADCDMEKAVEGASRAVFANGGQICLGTERLYVQRSVFDEFVEHLAKKARNLAFGAWNDAATTMGPLISEAHRDKVLGYYGKAREAGATIVAGGGSPDLPAPLDAGYWVEPTIWTGLTEHDPVVREEIFGPCCHIRPFDDENEVVALANDTRYGLAAALWTENLTRAHRVAGALEAGIVWVNSWFLRDLRTPFGGMKHSGIGREGGVHSFEFYTEMKNVCIKL
ncbi:MAG: 2-hydroxymuconic semialdehyde dehydrogenase [Gammaproteobacteria bacterium]|nr:2-hydroxymuconic semialdehyde dehydrogenase [Gammaproteobacteria bacterium]